MSLETFNTALQRLTAGGLTVNFSNAEGGVIVISAERLIKNIETLLSGIDVSVNYVVTRRDYSLMVITTED